MAVSWRLTRNKENGGDLYSAGDLKKTQLGLELVSPKGLEHQPREAPLKLVTGDVSLDGLLAEGDYSVEGIDSKTGDAEIRLEPKEIKSGLSLL